MCGRRCFAEKNSFVVFLSCFFAAPKFKKQKSQSFDWLSYLQLIDFIACSLVGAAGFELAATPSIHAGFRRFLPGCPRPVPAAFPQEFVCGCGFLWDGVAFIRRMHRAEKFTLPDVILFFPLYLGGNYLARAGQALSLTWQDAPRALPFAPAPIARRTWLAD